MLTVQGLLDELGLDAGRRRGGGRGADPLGAHQRAARPDAVAVGRRAAADHRASSSTTPTSSARSCAGSSTTTSPASASAPASSTTRSRRRCVEEAERLGFPLFEVPYEMPFIAITEKAFARLVNEQYEVLQRGIAMHRRLEQLVLEERGLEEVARALSAAIGGAVVMLDRQRRARWPSATFRRELPAGGAGGDPRRGRASATQSGRAVAFEPAPRRRRRAARSRCRSRPSRGGPRAWLVAIRDARRPGRLRAADPPAGGHGRGARADAPPRRARHRAPPGRRRARRGARRASSTRRELRGRLRPFGVGDAGRGAGVRRSPTRAARRPTLERALVEAGAPGAGRDREATCCARSSTARRGDPLELAARGARRAGRASTAQVRAAASRVAAGRRRCGAASTRRATRSRSRRCSNGRAPEVAS